MGWLGWLKRGNGDERSATSAVAEGLGGGAARLRRTRAGRGRCAPAWTRSSGRDDERFEIEREMLDGLEAVVELSTTIAHSGPTSDRHRPSRRRPRSLLLQRAGQPARRSGAAERHAPADRARADLRRRRAGADHAVAQRRARACTRTAIVLLVRTDRQDLHRLRCNTLRRRAARGVPGAAARSNRRV